MAEARLKSGIWVKALLRRCDITAIPAFVVRRGDGDAGAVFLKVNRFAQGFIVLSQTRDDVGRPAWLRATGPAPVDEAKADAYLARQAKFDPDLWVIEIEDRDGRFTPEDKILG